MKIKLIILVLGLFLTAIIYQLQDIKNILRSNNPSNSISKEQKYLLLSKITTDIQIDYLKNYLGEPVILNYSEDRKQKEYIFVDPDYYVQAVTNLDDKVGSYAITARSGDFNPVLRVRSIKIQLGKTTFYNKESKPTDCFAFEGNTAPSYYFEEYTGWNGTTYRDYLLGYNDSGYGDRAIVEATLPTEKDPINPTKNNKYSCRMPSDEERKKFTINTLIVSQAGFKSEFGYGVNRREMELINE